MCIYIYIYICVVLPLLHQRRELGLARRGGEAVPGQLHLRLDIMYIYIYAYIDV